jgi:hypothetical protein
MYCRIDTAFVESEADPELLCKHSSRTLKSTTERIPNPLPLRDATLLQARLNPHRHIRRNDRLKSIQIHAIYHAIAPHRRLNNIILESEKCLYRLLHARVLIRERRHEDCRCAVGVELCVQGALWEDGHLELVHGVIHVLGAVLGCHAGHEAALDDDVELSGAGVDVGRVEAAGAEEAEGHRAARAYEGGEGVAVCFYGLATFVVMLV